MTAPAVQLPAFNALEAAVLAAIAEQYRVDAAALLHQLVAARVTARRNTGVGFFTEIAVDREAVAPVALPSPVGEVWAEVDGFGNPMTFLLFLEDGYASMLEGATVDDCTTGVDFAARRFTLVS